MTTRKEKANKMIKESRGDLLEHKLKANIRLKNGGILMELDSNEVVEWLQSNKLHEDFCHDSNISR
jgi:hypothetical protein